MFLDWRLIIAGATVGLLVGLTGVGGGALMTPILLLVFGMAPMAAVGTDLWFAAITKLFATPVHQRHGLIDWQVVKRLWTGSLTASTLSLIWLRYHPIDSSSMNTLKGAVAITVMVTAIAMLFQKQLHGIGRSQRTTEGVKFKSVQGPLTVAAGAFLGILVTFTSVGAGALGAVFLVYLYPLRLTPPRLIATDIVHAIPLAIFAGLGHLFLGHVEGGLLLNLMMGSIPAVIIGAMLSARMPHAALRFILVLVLIAVGVKLLLSL
ncbi:MAG: sulfite exporter TauE/SafE family protein [Flavobacteriales bacterium]|nr:sulfite exporter TauE/SafE family protein [Flavobacteriales bacterium]MBK9536962.1 sulfite exporter TauE/SafE family protein [Flavobacteriales bacterium]HQX31596.1 sulfite exporter TauE/SafE family protein [Flavobacteriales bacterium]